MAFKLPKQSITKGSVFHKSALKQAIDLSVEGSKPIKRPIIPEEEVVEEPKRNLFENIFSKEAGAERRAKRNPEGKSPHEIKLEKELERMQNFGDASKFEIKAMERRLGRAQADRLASVEEEAAAPPEASKPVGYHTEGTQAYLSRFKEGGDLSDRQKPDGWYTKGHKNYGGEIEEIVEGDASRPTGYWTKGDPNYMKGVETRNLAEMPFFSPERKAYYEARNWGPDETVDPNLEKIGKNIVPRTKTIGEFWSQEDKTATKKATNILKTGKAPDGSEVDLKDYVANETRYSSIDDPLLQEDWEDYLKERKLYKKNPKEWEKKWGAYNPKSFGKYKDDYITMVDDEQAGWDEFDEWMSGK